MSDELAAAYVAVELPRAIKVGEGKWTVEQAGLVLFRACLCSPIDDEMYVAQFDCDGYRRLPPFIEFLDPLNGQLGTPRAYPSSTDGWFHPTPCICKPFSRKAYGAVGGPHSDWQFPDWVRNAPNHNTLADMLLGIYARLSDRQLYRGPMQARGS